MDYTNYKVYFTNTLQSVKQIIEEVTAVFVESNFTAVKIQIRFGVIWEGQTVEVENHEIISSYTKTLIDYLLPLVLSSSSPSSPSSSSNSQIIKQLETGRRYYPQNVYQTKLSDISFTNGYS
jgi:hypothetical protein